MTETRFKFGDAVSIVSGFYRGCIGRVGGHRINTIPREGTGNYLEPRYYDSIEEFRVFIQDDERFPVVGVSEWIAGDYLELRKF